MSFRFRVESPGLRERLQTAPHTVSADDGFEVAHPDTQLRFGLREVAADAATLVCNVPCTQAMEWALVEAVQSFGVATPEAVGAAFAQANAQAMALVADAIRAHVPASVLESAYRWNAARAARQVAVGPDVFVARSFYFALNGQLVRGAVWVDGVPALLPDCDVVVLQRHDIANRWMRQAPSAALRPLAEVVEALGLVREQDAWAYRPEKLEERVVRLFIDSPAVSEGQLVAVPSMHVFSVQR